VQHGRVSSCVRAGLKWKGRHLPNRVTYGIPNAVTPCMMARPGGIAFPSSIFGIGLNL